MITLTIDRNCVDSKGRHIPIGEVVRYVARLPGGMVKIEYAGVVSVINPVATKELRGA